MKKDKKTEDTIKQVARAMFIQKGFTGTTTREIASEAGTNLALVNYYFRSKEQLFKQIMLESLHEFFESVVDIFNDNNTTLEIKLERLVERYIDQLTQHPDIPMFILSEIRSNPEIFFKEFLQGTKIRQTVLFNQLTTHLKEKQQHKINPIHIMMNVMSMTLFPFIVKPMVSQVTEMSENEYQALMQERKKLIPMWVKQMVN
ncbi:MAG: TetR/AcrR family transcriptional regulator [Cyclobacteriaceae bacterium]